MAVPVRLRKLLQLHRREECGIATLSSGTTVTLSSGYSSSNPNVATASAAGVITGVAIGDATISVDYQSFHAEKKIHVLPNYNGIFVGNYTIDTCVDSLGFNGLYAQIVNRSITSGKWSGADGSATPVNTASFIDKRGAAVTLEGKSVGAVARRRGTTSWAPSPSRWSSAPRRWSRSWRPTASRPRPWARSWG